MISHDIRFSGGCKETIAWPWDGGKVGRVSTGRQAGGKKFPFARLKIAGVYGVAVFLVFVFSNYFNKIKSVYRVKPCMARL